MQTMGLFKFSCGNMSPLPATSFGKQGIFERQDLQAALRNDIAILDDNLLVIAEEYGEFEDSKRRIDLLCVDTTGALVVIELKRTDDGGHMELQALRYAAMVSTLTFQDVIEIFGRFLRSHGFTAQDAEGTLLQHFGIQAREDIDLSPDVRIVLVSEGFSKEITTTVLWLNENHQTDIRCFRIKPYNNGADVLIDLSQIIPLPEAKDYWIRRQKREAEARSHTNKDYTKYSITGPTGETEPLPKNQSLLEMVERVMSFGATPNQVRDILRERNLKMVPGVAKGEALRDAFRATFQDNDPNLLRWFVNRPIEFDGNTYILNANWGVGTDDFLAKLAALVPDSGISFKSHPA